MAIQNKIKADTIYAGAKAEFSLPCGLDDVPVDFETWNVYASFTEEETGRTTLIEGIDTTSRITLTAEGDIEFDLEAEDTVLLVDANGDVLNSVYLGIWEEDSPVPLFLGKIPVKQSPVAPLLIPD